MQTIRFYLDISPDDYIAYYKGTAKNVLTKSIDGRSIKFPANILQRFLTHNGIKGLFELRYDDNGKYSDIVCISENNQGV